MRKTKLLYSLALAPLLLGGYSDTEVGTDVSPLTITSLPKCSDGQFLVYRNNAIVCEKVGGAGQALPDCQSMNQLLTYTSSGELTSFGCVPKGSVMLSQTEQTTITNLQTQLTTLGTQITSIVGMGTRVNSRTYMGVTTAMTTGAMGGVKAASDMCNTAFAGSVMCDVYSVYTSLAVGKIPLNADISGAWVYQEQFTNPFASFTGDVTVGLGDNCGGYTTAVTSPVAGTKFTFAPAIAGDTTTRIPKFYSNTTCNTSLPIACCK